MATTRPVTCPRCNQTREMEISTVKGSGSLIFICPNCNGFASADQMQQSAVPGGPAPMSESEIAAYAKAI